MGPIYMVLGLAVMVPMALLTEEMISYLSTSLQIGDRDVQSGVAQAAVSELQALNLVSTDPNAVISAANAQAACRQLVKGRSVFELLENDQARVGANAFPLQARYLILPAMPVTTASAGTSPGVVLRLEGVASVPEAAGQTAPALTQASMLPQLLNPDVLNNATFLASSCSGFKAFRAIKISSCSVPDVKALHWRVLGGSWRWRWPQPPGLSSSDSIECPEGLFLYKL